MGTSVAIVNSEYPHLHPLLNGKSINSMMQSMPIKLKRTRTKCIFYLHGIHMVDIHKSNMTLCMLCCITSIFHIHVPNCE